MRPAASHAYTVAEETICEPSVGGLTPQRPPARAGASASVATAAALRSEVCAHLWQRGGAEPWVRPAEDTGGAEILVEKPA